MSAGTILVVEDNPITRRMMRFALESEGYDMVEAADGRTALELGAKRRPDLALQDYVLPDMDGLQLLDGLRALPGCANLPVVMVTGMVSQIEALRDRAGGPTSVLPKPLEPSRLVEIVRGYLAGDSLAPGGGGRILVVDDEVVGRKLAALRLRAAGFEVETAGSAEEALRKAAVSVPDAILSDVLMPGTDGFELCRTVRNDARLGHVPVVLLSSSFVDEPDRQLAEQMGASALLVRTPDLREAVEAVVHAVREGEPARPVSSGADVAALHAERVQAQLEKQMARNEALVRQGAIQAAALSVVRGLALALASPRDVPSILGDVLVHCLDAAGLSTGLLYLVGPDGQLRLQAQAGLPSFWREAAAQCFGNPQILRRAMEGGDPVPCLFGAEEEPGLHELGSGRGRTSGLIIPFLGGEEQIGVLILAADSQDLSESAWVGFGRALAVQFGQTIALGRFLVRGMASEVRYRTLMEQANDAVLVLDKSGIVEANRQAEVLLGQPGSPTVGRRYEDFLVPGERPEIAGGPGPAPGTGTRAGRRRLMRGDGTQVPVDVSSAVAQVGEESLELLILRDVTEGERMERKLRESEEQYRLLFESSPHPMWAYDPDTLGFLTVNDAAVRLYGYTREEFHAMKVTDIGPAGSVPGEPPGPGDLPPAGVWKHHRKDGSTLDVEIASSAITLRGASARLVLATDVSEKKLLEAQLLQAQKMEAVGRLAGGVAHDFNNLLGVITGYGDLLRRDLGPQHAAQRRVEEIRKAADRAAALTRQLLAFSRKSVIEPKVLDLNAIVSDLEKMLRRLIGEDIQFVLTPGTDLGHVRADASQIEQVIVNLVVNARDAMPRGGRLDIETGNALLDEGYARARTEVRPGPYVAITVTDTGHGMDATVRSRIFEPFFTTKEEGKGTGLGLATVFGIVKQSGGHIDVESEPGRGAAFKVYLPRIDGSPSRAAEGSPAPSPAGGSETVLLVEDAVALRTIIREVLEGAGYTVLESQEPEAALAAARIHTGPLDLVITDIVMPRMNGPELAARLGRFRPEARVLYISGYTDEAIGSRGVLQAGTHFLQKPFSADALLRKVREVLDMRPGSRD